MIVDGNAIETSASIGISGSPGTQIDIWKVLGDADLALYEAKKSGKRRYQVFDPDLRERAEFARGMKDDLQKALASGEQIVPYFQAQFDPKTLNLVGFEVLARWEHPTRGLLAPCDFLLFAEDMGCIAELDRQMLVSAVDCVRQWRKTGFQTPRLSVNVSSDRLLDPELINCVEELGDDADILSFELLETTFLDHTNAQVAHVLENLRQRGVDFEIDDFGSGYASILSLLNVRPTRLKIDRSLSQNVDTDPAMTSLVQSIVDIARALKIEVVAEGVESESQLQSLKSIGCDIVQGFHMAQPISSAGVLERFAKSPSLN